MPSSLRLRNAVTSSFIGGGNFQHMKYFDGTIYEPQEQREGVEVEINYVQTTTAQGLWFPNKARALHKRWKQHWPVLSLNEKGESSAEEESKPPQYQRWSPTILGGTPISIHPKRRKSLRSLLQSPKYFSEKVRKSWHQKCVNHEMKLIFTRKWVYSCAMLETLKPRRCSLEIFGIYSQHVDTFLLLTDKIQQIW